VYVLVGMPSARMVKAMAFLAKAMSDTLEAKRGRSWFSAKVPSTEVSVQPPLTSDIIFDSACISPAVKALMSGK
jgi:hypothetical protein